MNNAEDVFDFLFSPWTHTQAWALRSEQMIKSNYEKEAQREARGVQTHSDRCLWESSDCSVLRQHFNTKTLLLNIKSLVHIIS